ncbi:MAG: NADH:flavin oxidoreductase, partial [Gammaproteobacteria bacterium]|nr:NADH:flavin oxidoreductase [Gammaproteobacteria bacterium]
MDAGSRTYPNLFSEIAVGTRTVRNRIALPATLTNFGAGNRITDRWINFLAERARGGCGLIVTEIIAVDPEALAHAAIVTGYEDANDAGFERVAHEVHAAGSYILGQLWHPGRQQLWHPTRSPAGVSDQPDALSWTVPRVMTTQECARLVDAYVAVARRLARCGFDGVELHGAHGYLITQFLSPWSNTREDGYGGDLEGRTRFVREIAERIRDACGEGFIVGLKMPADEGVDGGIDVEEAARITQRLAATGAFDLFAYGQGNF